MARRGSPPGSLRHRSRREDELFDVAAIDPALHQKLVELRRTHPAAYRKELARLVRRSVIPAGRAGVVSAEFLQWLAHPVARVLERLRRAGDLDFRTVAALLEEERRRRKRAEVVAWLEAAYARALAAENRRG